MVNLTRCTLKSCQHNTTEFYYAEVVFDNLFGMLKEFCIFSRQKYCFECKGTFGKNSKLLRIKKGTQKNIFVICNFYYGNHWKNYVI